MTAEVWEKLQAAIPMLVLFEFDGDAGHIQKWKFLRLRDSGSGSEVVIYENDKMIEIKVSAPTDTVAAQQLLTVLQSQTVWVPDHDKQRFVTGWNPMRAEDSYIQEVSASVVAVMRDGLRMDLRRTQAWRARPMRRLDGFRRATGMGAEDDARLRHRDPQGHCGEGPRLDPIPSGQRQIDGEHDHVGYRFR